MLAGPGVPGGAGGVGGADQFPLPPSDLVGPLVKPGPFNTGVPPGFPLQVVFGDVVVTSPGAVVDSLDIHGFLRVQAPGVTIRRSIVRGRDEITQNALIAVEGGGNTLVEDTEIAPSAPSPSLDGIATGPGGFLGRRLNIHGTVDGVKADSGSTIQSSWIHDLVSFSSDPNQGGGASHNDAVQILRGSGIVLVGNTLEVGRSQNSAVQITQDVGAVTNVRVERNWVDGGGCTFNFSHKGGGPMDGISASENRFGRNSYFHCAILISSQTVLAGEGNVYDDTGEDVPINQHD